MAHDLDIPPMRQNPGREDDLDGKRIAWAEDLWSAQSWALRDRDKQVEENVRMLAGQQWMVYSDLLGRWKDVTDYLNDDEKRWRQRPVVNRLAYWFMLTHSRMTENPPVVSFSPSSGDRADARLAEVLDTIHKTLWDEIGMPGVLDRLFSWLIPGGSAYLKTRVDLEAGAFRPWIGPYTMDGPEGPVFMEAVPFDEQGNPQVELVDGGEGYEVTGEPFVEREGQVKVDVLPPMSVRGEWGANIPWREKRWHMHRSLLSAEEVYDRWGVKVEPDVYGPDEEGAGELHRLLFGSGYFGATSNEPGSWGNDTTAGRRQGYVQVDELWMAPSNIVEGMAATDRSPGGRLLIRAGNEVLHDGPRPVHYEGPSPIQKFSFVNMPGRPDGTTVQEWLNPIQRTINRGYAQIMEHRNLVTNPMAIIDSRSGIEEEQLTNKPGLVLKNVTRREGVPAIEFVRPPELSGDVYRTQAMLDEDFMFLGHMQGATGDPPTDDPSGTLVKELRFNSDRFLGPTMKRAAESLKHVIEDINALLPHVWDREKVISYAGEDQVSRTVTVYPEMFERGAVNVQIDMESMLPESRRARQDKIWKMYQAGLFGPPGTPESRSRFFELARFPHMDRATQPGGIDRITAQRENGRMIQGVPPDEIPVLQTYDHEVHVQVHKQFINSPDFLEQPRQVQWAFMLHMRAHMQYLEFMQQQELAREMAIMEGMSEAQGGGGLGGAPGSQAPSREIEQRREEREQRGEGDAQPAQTNGNRISSLTSQS